MNRNLTLAIHFVLDYLLPPVLRDSRWFMGGLFRLALGPKYRYYLEFKERLPWLSDQEIGHYYTLLADTFIRRPTDLNRQSAEAVFGRVKGGSVLDVACGSGWLSNELAKRGFQVTGADIVPPKEGGQNPLFCAADVCRLPFPDKCFDTVVCTHTLEHVRDPRKALSELRRVCRQRLIVIVPRQREYRYTFDLHIHFFPYAYRLQELMSTRAQIVDVGGDFLAQEDFEHERLQ
ncbi:MAG: methyltransferase domain-containing protein [Brachymonas sp.]|nr:methyltransferase domain-containing protein [Brachymonas sp.]